MEFKPNDTCYIMESNTPTLAKVMRKQNDTYFVQRIGVCGALQLSEDEMYKTEEEAKSRTKKPTVTVSSQFSDI